MCEEESVLLRLMFAQCAPRKCFEIPHKLIEFLFTQVGFSIYGLEYMQSRHSSP